MRRLNISYIYLQSAFSYLLLLSSSPLTLHPPQQSRSPTSTRARTSTSISPCYILAIPPTTHLPIPSPLPCRIICIQHPRLTLVRLTKRIPPLFPHPLHLPDLPDCLLELFHPRSIILDIVFLNLLDVMICLRLIHAFAVFPCYVSEQARGW